MKNAYVKTMTDLNHDPDRGTSFETYQKAIEFAKDEGNPIANPSQLQEKVGGKYHRARIAFECLSSGVPENHVVREVPGWFMKPVQQAIQIDIEKLWSEVDRDISAIVNSRIKLAHADRDRCEQQLVESDGLIDRLQVQLEDFNELQTRYGDLLKQNDNLNRDSEKTYKQLLEQQNKLDLSLELERGIIALEVINDGLKERNERLDHQLNELNQIMKNLLVENGTLKGIIQQIKDTQQ